MVDGPASDAPEDREAPLSFFAEVAPALIAVAALWAVSLWAWPRLPARVPTHWGLAGRPDAWGPKSALVFTLPGVFTGLVGLVILLSRPALDFKYAARMDPRVRRAVLALTSLLFVSFHGYTLLHLLRGSQDEAPAMFWVPMGLFFVLLGNLLPKLEPNQWVGIRIPPTLEDRRIWKSTHRFAAPLFMGAEFILLLASLLPPALGAALGGGAFLLALIPPIVHAYRLRNRLS